ncbi:MAG: ATP-binding protein [Candidatus Marsarchaeota archaeon]|nr:ATP-binding protein [Candidatus Marsarchaeota archaeon]
MEDKELSMSVHGRLIDQLGSQTYQSPVGSISEYVSNAWDAEALHVWITLPKDGDSDPKVVIKDDGNGMDLGECEGRYLKVGLCRRGKNATEESPNKHRAIIGRKGIGKFAGFGIANNITIETISKATGERTVFLLDINELNSTDYVGGSYKIKAKYEGPDPTLIQNCGTTVTLSNLTIKKGISKDAFPKSLARKFLILGTADEFEILVDEVPIPEAIGTAKIQFEFPKDYKDEEKPDGMKIDGVWAKENVAGKEIFWRVIFYKDTIEEEELQGISIFSDKKIVQYPFFFNLSGGLGGQAGQSYMSGQVRADFINRLPKDVISAERQRVNWVLPDTEPLLEWGKQRTKKLLELWHDRRGEKRAKELLEKIADFSPRLEKLPKGEAKTVRSFLEKMGRLDTLDDKQFNQLGSSFLTAWEGGRLKDLMLQISQKKDFDEQSLWDMLLEVQVISALNIAESVKTKLLVLAELKKLITEQALEKTVRDHIAKDPWIIGPEWETYKVETGINNILEESAKAAKLDEDDAFKGRADLVLSSKSSLHVVEFMRPGLTLDLDHINRFENYIRIIKTKIKVNTKSGFDDNVTGTIVADGISKKAEITDKIVALKKESMLVTDWSSLFEQAIDEWRDYLKILASRGEGDDRLKNLLE